MLFEGKRLSKLSEISIAPSSKHTVIAKVKNSSPDLKVLNLNYKSLDTEMLSNKKESMICLKPFGYQAKRYYKTRSLYGMWKDSYTFTIISWDRSFRFRIISCKVAEAPDPIIYWGGKNEQKPPTPHLFLSYWSNSAN